MSAAGDALRAQGWAVIEGDEAWQVKQPDYRADSSWIAIPRNQDGTLALIPDRSSVHRRVAAAIRGLSLV